MRSLFPMTDQHLASLALFAFVSSITPGPNNLMLMASGANFGFRRTVPHLLGVGLGFCLLVTLVGTSLGHLLGNALFRACLQGLSVLFMVWLAIRIARAAPLSNESSRARPMTFAEAAAFQWVNPKAWAMAVSAIGLYGSEAGLQQVLLVALVFGAVNLPSVASWTLLGLQIARLLKHPLHRSLFNYGLAGLLLVSLVPILLA